MVVNLICVLCISKMEIMSSPTCVFDLPCLSRDDVSVSFFIVSAKTVMEHPNLNPLSPRGKFYPKNFKILFDLFRIFLSKIPF